MSLLLRAVAAATVVACGLALAGCARKARSDEELMRAAYIESAAIDAGLGSAFLVSGRWDVHLEDGFGPIMSDPPDDFRAKPFRWVGQVMRLRLRRHGDHRMKLAVIGWADLKTLQTRPNVTLRIDHRLVHDAAAASDGFWSGGEVPSDWFGSDEWITAEIILSSVSFHWGDPPLLKVALVSSVTWTEVP